MKKLFAFFFLVFFSMSFNVSSNVCTPVPQCQGPPVPPFPCEAYWVCECAYPEQGCPTADGRWMKGYESVYYW